MDAALLLPCHPSWRWPISLFNSIWTFAVVLFVLPQQVDRLSISPSATFRFAMTFSSDRSAFFVCCRLTLIGCGCLRYAFCILLISLTCNFGCKANFHCQSFSFFFFDQFLIRCHTIRINFILVVIIVIFVAPVCGSNNKHCFVQPRINQSAFNSQSNRLAKSNQFSFLFILFLDSFFFRCFRFHTSRSTYLWLHVILWLFFVQCA